MSKRVEAGQTWRLKGQADPGCLYLVTSVEGHLAKILCLFTGWRGNEVVSIMESEGTLESGSAFEWERFT